MDPPRLLLIGGVADRILLSISSVNRLLRQARNGQGNFPLPVSPPRSKLRWLESDIERYINARDPPSISSPAITNSQKKRQEEKSYQARQRDALAALERHRSSK